MGLAGSSAVAEAFPQEHLPIFQEIIVSLPVFGIESTALYKPLGDSPQLPTNLDPAPEPPTRPWEKKEEPEPPDEPTPAPTPAPAPAPAPEPPEED